LRQALGHARIGLGVGGGGLDLLAQNAAGGIDFLDGQFDTVLEVGPGRGAAARKLDDVGDLDRVLAKTCASGGQQGTGCQQLEGVSFLHEVSPWIAGWVKGNQGYRRLPCPCVFADRSKCGTPDRNLGQSPACSKHFSTNLRVYRSLLIDKRTKPG
jgi:hypothetical protein